MEIINKEIEIRNIKPTANRHTLSIFKLLEILNEKFETFSSLIDSKIAETNLNNKINIIIFIIGNKIVAKIKIKPVAPIAFLIKILLASINPTPSDKYEPKIGI